jgi:DNA modification methylase
MAGLVKDQLITDRFAIYNCDSMELLTSVPDDSIHAAIYSPPFGGLYHYSSDDRDLSNAPNEAAFFEQYDHFVHELYRVLMPGRTIAVHASLCKSGNSGRDHYEDFPGDVIRAHRKRGFLLKARHVIWKEPLAVRNRTMSKGLAHKTIVVDASAADFAAPDELLVFYKPGAVIEPINHPNGLTGNYAGSEQPPPELAGYRGWDGDQKQNRWSHWIWRRYASAVWDDIRLGRTLPFHADPDDEDAEKHVHPLQLDVIERYLDLRTKPGERVLTPFMGVGSEVYMAVRMGRFGIGAELKPSYYQQAVQNLAMVDLDDSDSAIQEGIDGFIDAEWVDA